MNYPLISEYVEAIKSAEDNFEELNYLRPVLGDDGLPVMTSGNFAVVFKMKDVTTGKLYALKCFTKEQEGRTESYRLITDELEFVSSNYLTPIRYLEKELFVDTEQTDETEFPILLMDWVEGVPMDKYIQENIHNHYALELLSFRFSHLAKWLFMQPFAHGDLKPDNILVKEDGSIVLVDYDGMYVPAMRGQNARELGSPNFRHPSRTEESFDERIDDFSIALIALSLKAFSLNTELISEYCSNDFMLFRVEDFSHINSCQAMSSILNIVHDDELTSLLGTFMIAYAKNSLNLVSPNIFILKKPKEGQAYADYIYNQARNLCEEATDKSKVDYNKAFKLFQKGAKLGNADAQCCLGCCFKNGYGTQVDYTKAREWYDIASGNGCARALRHIGFCYEYGQGVEKAMKEAISWYLKAIEQGDKPSMEIMGKIYYFGGGGIPIDYAQAVMWFTKAAKAGEPDGMWILGSCYKYGNGVEKDIDEAIKWYQLSSNKGNTKAQWRLGLCYFNGEGVAKDYKVAVQWFQKAADGYDYDGQWRLGHCYEYGLGIEKNLCSAFNYYQKAAKAGSSEGQWRLGRCYEHGLGTQMNLPLAKSFYEQAAKKGNKKAQEALKRMENDDLPF